MSFSQIKGTPAQISLWYVPVDSPPPPSSHPLNTTSANLLLDVLNAQLSTSVQAALAQLFGTPLDQLFDTAWQQLKADPATNPNNMVVQAIQGAISDAYNVQSSFPAKGTLQAQVTPYSATGSYLELQYLLPGVTCSFSEHAGGIWGGWADPSYNLSFDATLEVDVWVPKSSASPLGATVQLNVTNMQAWPSNAFAVVNGIVNLIGAWLSEHTGSGSALEDQIIPINVPAIATLFSELSSGFSVASQYGFVGLAVQVNTSPPSNTAPGNTVEFDLTYPWETPGPTVFNANALAPGVPDLLQAEIVPSVPQINAGGTLMVTGNYFPAAQASQLTISWGDVTMGGVSQSEVQWGITSTSSNQASPPVTDVKIARTSPSDGLNVYTAGTASAPLTPSTSYSFRVRDYDVENLVATDWGTWLPIMTTPTNEVDLVLSYGETTVGSVILKSAGSFSTTITIPAAVPPGTYTLSAVMSGQPMAQATLTVVAAGTELPAVLQFVNAATGVPLVGTMLLIGGSEATVAGSSFVPGNVNIFIDSPSGTQLGTANVGFGGTFTFTLTWPQFVLGAHTVHAQQATDSADAPLYAEMPAK